MITLTLLILFVLFILLFANSNESAKVLYYKLETVNNENIAEDDEVNDNIVDSDDVNDNGNSNSNDILPDIDEIATNAMDAYVNNRR